MPRFLPALASAALVLAPAAAHAGEVFGGIYAHNVDTPLTIGRHVEDGPDLQLGWRGGRIGHSPFQPYLLGSLNTAGHTSFVSAGISARFGKQLYVRPGLGIAVHTGSAAKYDIAGNDRIEFGSRVLFEPELGVGVQIAPRISAEASWVHLSHAQLFGRENPGIDNIGVRLNVALP